MILLTALLLTLLSVSSRADSLSWRAARNAIDADVQSWPFDELLENLANATGWEIFVEPNATNRISTRFKDLSVNEALPRLLRDLNYALMPQTNRPPKLFIYKTSIQEATLSVAPKKEKSAESKAIANELVVGLRNGSKEAAEMLAAKLGGKISGQIDGKGLYRMQFEDEAAAKVARSLLSVDPSVSSVDTNYLINQPPTPEGLQLSSGVPFSLKPDVPGSPGRIVVGLIDSPVQTQSTRLKDFLVSPTTVTGLTEAPTGDITHGTSMAETILQGVAMANTGSATTPVRILPVDVYGASETTSTFDVAQGIIAAVKGGATIINLSLGTSGDSPFLHTLIQEYAKQGVAFIGAAGNEPVKSPSYPAAYLEVLAVTAGDKSGNVASYANRGDFVDVIAPGASIVSYGGQSYLGMGTSFSTAYISGLAAGMAAQSGKPLGQVTAQIRQSLGFKTK